MRHKGAIIFFTGLITLLCLYHLSFTYIARKVQKQAVVYATLTDGSLDNQKKQDYLDSVWLKPVYSPFGIDYTYQQVKEQELNLGLDLQGGMHITLEVSPVEILKSLSGNSQDAAFNEALKKAAEMQKTSQQSFVSLFYDAYKQIAPEGRLATLFSNSANKDKINYDSSDEEVLAILEEDVNSAIDRSFNILRTRVDKFGVSQPNIMKLPGTGRIQVELPGVDNPERVRKLLQGVAKLEFLEVYQLNEIAPVLEQANQYLLEKEKQAEPALQTLPSSADMAAASSADSSLLTGADSLAAQLALGADSATTDSLATPKASKLYSLLKVNYGLVYSLADTAEINSILADPAIKAMFPINTRFHWGVKPIEAGNDKLMELYALRTETGGRAQLTGEVITDARQEIEQNGPAVNMQMNTEGARKWKKLTSENVGRQIAIVLDGSVYSAPNVQGEIPNGNSSITGNFTIDEAKDLANILKAGKLPAPTRIVEEAVVGPSLGSEAIMQGLVSMAAGLGLVVLFMVVYYGAGGLVANLALLVNVFFIIGILSQFSASLTLPGIAGIVLTIGMSVDANVLIFERIREELRNGSSLIQAIKLGYDKAYSSIIDSNVTTFLTGAILYSFGSGGIKGFAVVLMIGIACSLFTAVFITRLVIEYMAQKRGIQNISFSTPFSTNLMSNLNIDFIKSRKLAYTFSGIVIALGLASIVYQGGLNLGVDFKGGRSYVIRFDTPVVASDVRSAVLDNVENAGLEVKTFGADNQLKITTSYLIDDESDEADKKVEQALLAGLDSYQQQHPQIMSSSKIGATIADDIKDASTTSVLYSLIVIFGYILIRFRKWQYGLGAVVALFHDVLIVLSGFSLARLFGISYEIDQVFIAAVLTVIGYSINDTVVVFDRIREFAGSGSREDLSRTLNKSINDTLSRTLITSLTVFIVVLVLFMFGGEVLRGFSFALLVGVIFGTYSSIFIASPIVLDLTGKSIARQAEEAKKGIKQTA
jgi:SecD/SecF fusion protein